MEMDTQDRDYTFRGQKLSGELAQQLDESRVTGLSGTEGVVVYAPKGAKGKVYFVQAYVDGQKVRRENMTEALQGLLEWTTKEFAKKGTRRFSLTRTLTQ